ncbi:MAG: restriction endonuclease subunit S [Desulfobulbaceae bacterium]|nr:restriction endonuclease subunit S [Desulfobulbaceae bacterium]
MGEYGEEAQGDSAMKVGWGKKTIGHLFDVQLGKMLSEKAKTGTQFPYLANFNVRWGKFDFSKLNEMNFSDWEKAKYKLQKGDLLMCEGGEIGRCAIWQGADMEIYYQKALHRVRPKRENISTNYLYLYMQFIASRGKLTRLVGETSIAHLTREKLLGLAITFPPLPEQKAIADLLSTWDEAIEKAERLILVKEKQLRQMSRWLLLGHKRLGNQKIELADGHIFEYPSDWELVKIGKVAKEVSARNGESEETVLSCSKYDGFVNSLDYFGKQVFSSDTSNYKVVKKGQFGYPSNHVEEGSIGLLEHCEKGIVSPIYVVFEASKEKVHSPYLYKLLKTDIYRHIFQVRTSSSVYRRGSLRWGDFSKIKVLIPSLEEQQQISETLSSAQHEIDLLKQLAEKYKTQKRGLMQKMLNGKWRVKPEIVNQYTEA